MHAVLELSRTSQEQAALSRASQHGLAIEGLGSYRADRTGPDDGDGNRAGLVIGYGRPPEHAYTTALARLGTILPDLPPQGTMGAGGSSEAASRNGMTALARSGEKQMS